MRWLRVCLPLMLPLLRRIGLRALPRWCVALLDLLLDLLQMRLHLLLLMQMDPDFLLVLRVVVLLPARPLGCTMQIMVVILYSSTELGLILLQLGAVPALRRGEIPTAPQCKLDPNAADFYNACQAAPGLRRKSVDGAGAAQGNRGQRQAPATA